MGQNTNRDAEMTKETRPKYKRLTQRDTIQAGDEYRTNWGTWWAIKPEFIGKQKGKIFSHYTKMRRKVPNGEAKG